MTNTFAGFRPVWVAIVALGVSAPAMAADRKIYIMTDLEGASGVYSFAQTRARRLRSRTRRRNTSWAISRPWCAGCGREEQPTYSSSTATAPQAFVPHLMAPGAKYLTGKPRKEFLWGLDKSVAGLVLLAHHAMNGTPDGVLCHTQSSKTENRYWYNGVESGELAQVAAVAGHYGVPPILVTGDEATCRESQRFFGADCVTVAVKRGLARESAVLYPFEETRKALHEGAKQSVAAIPKCKPYRLALPIKAKKQFLQFDDSSSPKLATKEGTIADVLRLFDF